jgi:transposase
LATFIDRNHFNYLVRKYGGDKYVKHFTCWNQLLAMMFGQLGNRESLRDLIVALEAHQQKCYHLGLGRDPVAKTTLATANQNRDYRIFEEFAFYMMDRARKKRIDHIFKLNGNVYAFDSTTIPLCLSVFWWAKFRKRKGGVKVHFLYDLETTVPAFFHITKASAHDSKAMCEIPYESGSYYVFDRGYNAFAELFKIHRKDSFFVVRAKKNLQYRCVKWRRRLPKNILTDAEIVLAEEPSFKKYPEKLRLVRCHDAEQDRDFAFLTNAFHLKALEIANLYRNRWQIELFHKWLKQHLKIKRFWGTTENAVRIQISVAIITYCLVAIVQHDMQLERSTYEVLQILNISLTDKTPLKDLFNKTNINNVKEQFDPLIPGLFD